MCNTIFVILASRRNYLTFAYDIKIIRTKWNNFKNSFTLKQNDNIKKNIETKHMYLVEVRLSIRCLKILAIKFPFYINLKLIFTLDLTLYFYKYSH